MAGAYRAPLGALDAHLTAAGADALADLPRFAEATVDTRRAVLAEAARLAEGTLAPLDAPGDRAGARIENAVVRLPPGFAAAWAALGAGGWPGLCADPAHGGAGLPQTWATAVTEIVSGANLSLSIPLLLTQGHVEALEAHAPPDVRARWLPELVSGRWTGTMNLTEAGAGSDVGALTTRAEPGPDGAFRLTGEKIYISWGDHDAAENVSHLVLARLPGAPPGPRGVSLFLAARRPPKPDGTLGAPGAIRCLRLEDKMGLHASPTCVMAYDGAEARLIGEPHRGLAAMFTMMNTARLTVAAQGVGAAEAACRIALAHAATRRQGRTDPAAGGLSPPGATGPILDHADVRRMLAAMRARTEAARALLYACAVAGDRARAGDDPAQAARAAFLTPVVKAFATDVGTEAANLCVQVLGGLGYVEDAGAAQILRDVRVAAIYEGANGVQAMDLVTRKLGDGTTAAALLADAGVDVPAALRPALAALDQATAWMLRASAADRAAGAEPYLRAWALTLGGAALARAGRSGPDAAALAAFFLRREAAAVPGLCAAATDGAATLAALDLSRFGA
jgi:alkylation response protein AidB-like acyl-CoA dehydrogenase